MKITIEPTEKELHFRAVSISCGDEESTREACEVALDALCAYGHHRANILNNFTAIANEQLEAETTTT